MGESFPLTNSIIFQDGHIAPQNQIYYSLDQVLITNNHYKPLLITIKTMVKLHHQPANRRAL